MSHYRILDANLNRAREGFRVIEDHARFVFNSNDLSLRCKQARNTLADIAQSLGTTSLIDARDTERDVGTALSTPRENQRRNSSDVIDANFKRAQEALRVLEETSKTIAPSVAHTLETLRYTTYTLERDFLRHDLRFRLEQENVMLIVTASQCKRPVAEVVAAAYDAGVRLFQVREKAHNDAELFDRIGASVEFLKSYGDALIVVNDRCDIARAVGAHGVHLGQDDLPPERARTVVGDLMLIGTSTHNIDEVTAAQSSPVDYLGAGAMFDTTTKDVTHRGGPAFGVQATQASSKPVYCIGGVNTENAAPLKHEGVKRVAVCGAVCGADDPKNAAETLVQMFMNEELDLVNKVR